MNRFARHWQEAALLLLSFAFRIPPLLNADSTNSDAAVVGLQAMHILKGEFSAFLWGNGYQSSVDSFFAALFFLALGKTPFALMLSALSLHVALTFIVYLTLRRHVSKSWALLLVLPLVFTPSSVHTYALYPPRQASLTLAFAALSLIDRAQFDRRRCPLLALGAFVFGLACYADPYPLVLAPLVATFALLVAWLEPSWVARAKQLGAAFVGALVGMLPNLWLRHAAAAKNGPMTLSTDVVGHNFRLLVDECLPWAMSTKIYFAKHTMDYSPWEMPAWLHPIQVAAAALAFAVALSGIALFFAPSLERRSRNLGVVGAICFPITLSAFLGSLMVMDHFSMRYLAVLTLTMPFAALPLAKRFESRASMRGFALLFMPWVVASAIGGWVGYGPFVHGLAPVNGMPTLKDDIALIEAMKGQGVRFALADYWASYRLTFLSKEELVVVPLHEGQDRYRPYRDQLERAAKVAYVFDPERSFENRDEALANFRKRYRSVEQLSIGALTVLVMER